MDTNRSIKIIKRKQGETVEDDKPELSLKRENEIRREIINTITSWVECHREGKKDFYRSIRATESGLELR